MINVQSLTVWQLKASRIKAQLMQDRGVDICDVVSVFNGVEADFVGGSVHHASFQTPTRHPDRESKDVVITAGRSL